jgi:hypothetical protein
VVHFTKSDAFCHSGKQAHHFSSMSTKFFLMSFLASYCNTSFSLSSVSKLILCTSILDFPFSPSCKYPRYYLHCKYGGRRIL